MTWSDLPGDWLADKNSAGWPAAGYRLLECAIKAVSVLSARVRFGYAYQFGGGEYAGIQWYYRTGAVLCAVLPDVDTVHAQV